MPSTPRFTHGGRLWGWAPTKEEHDEIVARRGRNFTDGPLFLHAGGALGPKPVDESDPRLAQAYETGAA